MQISKPNALHRLAEIRDTLSLAPAGLITDIDGAISPIAPTPEEAQVSSVCRDALETLCSRMALVAAVSGRDALKAREMVGLDGMVYVGNHGLERWQDGGILIHEEARQYVPVVREVVEALGRGLDAPGLIVEDKGVTASVHYRLSPNPCPDAGRHSCLPGQRPRGPGPAHHRGQAGGGGTASGCRQ